MLEATLFATTTVAYLTTSKPTLNNASNAPTVPESAHASLKSHGGFMKQSRIARRLLANIAIFASLIFLNAAGGVIEGQVITENVKPNQDPIYQLLRGQAKADTDFSG